MQAGSAGILAVVKQFPLNYHASVCYTASLAIIPFQMLKAVITFIFYGFKKYKYSFSVSPQQFWMA